MSTDDQYAKWLDTYTDLLIAELDARDCDIEPGAAREFIESTISMIATTTGTSEREARLSITETAVSAWAAMLIEAQDEDDISDFVAISGVLVAALQTWAASVLPLIDVFDHEDVDGVPLDAAMNVAEIISLVEAGFLIDAGFVGALEVSLPEDMAHSLVADLSIVTDWIDSPDVASKLSELELPEDLVGSVDPDASLADVVPHLAELGRNIIAGLDTYHRHIGDDDEAVLHYDDITE